jgi:hypothetical protein
MAQGSVILFVLAIGVAVVAWTMWSGGEIVSPLAIFQSRHRDKTTDLSEAQAVPKEPAARRALDGAPLDAPHSGDYVAVMIDNMSPARPASGLSKAVLVIEAPVESSITRLQAYFDPADEVAKIGPVRSVRPYYIDWATETDAMIVHVGGSPAALDILKAGNLRDLNEFFYGVAFWRDAERYAPHNAYTSTEKLRGAMAHKYGDHTAKAVPAWMFKDDAAHAKAALGDIAMDAEWPTLHISYNAAPYDVDWRYDAGSNTYVREQGGKLQEDGEVPLRAKNVAVQFTTVKVLDEVGRRSVVTKGSGDAIVATDGKIIKGTWETLNGRTRFVDAEGDEIVFNAGTTWVQVVPTGFDVTMQNYE